MAIQSYLPTDKIVRELMSLSSISTLATIYDGKPVNEPNGIYITTRTLSENRVGEFMQARIELVFVGQKTTRPQELREVIGVVSDALLKGCENNNFFYDGFCIYAVRNGSLLGPGYDEKDRPIYTKDYLFSYAYENG